MTILRIPSASGLPISRATAYGGVLYLSGLVARPGARGDVGTQVADVLQQISELCAETGTDRSRLLWVQVWLADISDFKALNAVWSDWLGTNAPPARATVEARLALPELRVEMGGIAALHPIGAHQDAAR